MSVHRRRAKMERLVQTVSTQHTSVRASLVGLGLNVTLTSTNVCPVHVEMAASARRVLVPAHIDAFVQIEAMLGTTVRQLWMSAAAILARMVGTVGK